MKWKTKKIGNNEITYRNYSKENEIRTFIILKDDKCNFNLFISRKNIIKTIDKDVYSLNLSKLKHIPLSMAKQNDFIKDFLGNQYSLFLNDAVKMQLSNYELNATVEEIKDSDKLERILKEKTNKEIKIESIKVEEINKKNTVLSNIFCFIKSKLTVKKNKLLFFK